MVACGLVLVANVSPASAAAAKLHGGTFVSRTALEHAVGNRFAVAHDSGDSPLAAGCHFPSKRIGGTDLGLYVSTDVRAGMLYRYYMDLMERGFDPESNRPGECGCNQ